LDGTIPIIKRKGKSFQPNYPTLYESPFLFLQGPGWLTQGISNNDNEPTLKGARWRSGSDPETHGIWAWSQVFIINGTEDEKVTLLLPIRCVEICNNTCNLYDRLVFCSWTRKVFSMPTIRQLKTVSSSL